MAYTTQRKSFFCSYTELDLVNSYFQKQHVILNLFLSHSQVYDEQRWESLEKMCTGWSKDVFPAVHKRGAAVAERR